MTQSSPISEELLAILACPACKEPVVLEGNDRLVCTKCGRTYPIVDGIPVMLLDEPVEEERLRVPPPPSAEADRGSVLGRALKLVGIAGLAALAGVAIRRLRHRE